MKYKNKTPSVYYVYKMCDQAEDMLLKMRKNNYTINKNYKILDSIDIKDGYDSVGLLFLFKDNKKSFSIHSILNNNFAKSISQDINCTLIQTACGLFCGIKHIMNNPNNGVNTSEDIDHLKSIDLVRKYMGYIHYGDVDFKPKHNSLKYLLV